MCWPSLEGGIEIEERVSKHPNGPRRKRLHFVKDRHSARDSDEWQLIHPGRPHREMVEPTPPPRPWYDVQHRDRYLPPQQIPGHIPAPPLHHGHQPQLGFHGPQHQLDHHPHHDPGDEIVRVEEFVPRDEQHYQVQLPPRIIEAEPRARMPTHLRPRSRSRGRGHSRHGSGSDSLFSGSSYSDSHHGGRGRRRSVYSDNDSFREVRVEPRTSVRRVTRYDRR